MRSSTDHTSRSVSRRRSGIFFCEVVQLGRLREAVRRLEKVKVICRR